MNKILLLCATLTMAIATASTHRIVFYENATLNGKELNAGEYKMKIDGDKISLKKGKTAVDAAVIESRFLLALTACVETQLCHRERLFASAS